MSKHEQKFDNDFYKRISEPFAWENVASLENTPIGVVPVMQDLIEAMRKIYGDDGALYVHGSSVSGNFREGVSDIDALWIALGDMPDDHMQQRTINLAQIDTRNAVGYLDVVAMPAIDINYGGRKSQVFCCAYNGVQVAGKGRADFGNYLPKTKGDYFSCQYDRFDYIIELCRQGYDLDTVEKRSPRSLAKSLARAIYCESYFRGCPYEQGLPKMHTKLVEYGFLTEAAEFDRYLAMSQRSLSEYEKQEVFIRAGTLAPLFKQIVEANSSPYGVWVQDWLDQQA